MTPVQAAAIESLLSRRDVVVQAETGSGKTLAFLLPVLDMLLAVRPPLQPFQIGAAVVVPTRELAQQIFALLTASLLPQYPGVAAVMCTGGYPVERDRRRIEAAGCNVVVATPGRLLELFEWYAREEALRHTFNAQSLEALVFDEADRLLDLGFEPAVSRLLRFFPKQRRTGLFSATLSGSDSLSQLIRVGLRNPVRIVVEREQAGTGAGTGTGLPALPESLAAFYHSCGADEKLLFLAEFLRRHPAGKTIVYFATCASVDYFYHLLREAFPDALRGRLLPLHGRYDGSKRRGVLRRFSEAADADGPVLLCTDVAARGLDVPLVRWVVQYDLPQDPAAFVHRSGRTARMGQAGSALALLMPNESVYRDFCEGRQIRLQQLPVDWQADPDSARRQVYEAVARDRLFIDKGARSFVSYIRHYSAHRLAFLLKTEDLDLGACIRGFFLLSVPKMPELRAAGDLAGAVPGAVPLESIDYRDPLIKAQAVARRQRRVQRQPRSEKCRPWSRSREMRRRGKSRAAPQEARHPREPGPDGSLADDYREYRRDKRRRGRAPLPE